MNLKELDSFKLSDAVKFHKTLNPNLWHHNRLRPEVKKQLKKIAQDFIEELGINGLDVVDLTVSGSNAAYSYTPHSDLDLHILVDMSQLPNDEVYRELFTAKKTIYNDTHNIKIHGVPVELYVQDVNEPVISLGEYSLLQDKWIKMPAKKRANFDQSATKHKYEKLLALIKHALKYKDINKLNNVIKKIRQYRQAGLDKGGEFSPENLAYKALRNQDYITKLYDLRDKLHSEELTIETMYQSRLLNKPTLNARMLAAKHNVPVKHILDQLKKGIQVEKEHTTYGQTAREIALDHLAEDPNYYTKLKKANLEEEKYDELPEKVYHVTPSENLDSIMSKGLMPDVGDRSRKIEGEKPAVYCFPDKNSMEDAVMNWLGDEFDEDEPLALLEIFTTGLKGQVTDGAQYEVAITSIIPPQNIRILSKDLATPINEDINPEVVKPNFHAEKDIEIQDVGPLKLVAKNVSTTHPPQFRVDVFRPDGQSIGYFRFVVLDYDPKPKFKFFASKKNPYIIGGNVSVWNEYQKKGIATQVYKWIKSMGNDIKPSPTQTSAGKAMWSGFEKNQSVAEDETLQFAASKTAPTNPYGGFKDKQYRGAISETFDQPYPIKWEKSEFGDYDALATLPDGNPLTIMFNHESPEEVVITFWRNNNLELTGEGDAQRVFATVLQSIQEFLKIEQPEIISFSASKEVEPGQKMMSRSKLYDRLVSRYAQQWGYNAKTVDHEEGVVYNLTRKQNVAEASGYIPSEKEKNDPRFKTALTVDVKPDSIKKNAKAFYSKVSRAGIPPILNPSGKY